MKTLAFLALLLLSTCLGMNNTTSRPEEAAADASAKSFYDFKLNGLDGQPVDFAKFKGKKVLLVNVASECGYTPQYKELQELHTKYGEKVTVLGFPANNFGGQEPGSNTEIASFCKKNYGVSFQMFEKISVKGNDQHPLYQWLSQKAQNGWNDEAPKWNFHKYLVNEKGQLVKVFGSGVAPMSPELIKAISE